MPNGTSRQRRGESIFISSPRAQPSHRPNLEAHDGVKATDAAPILVNFMRSIGYLLTPARCSHHYFHRAAYP